MIDRAVLSLLLFIPLLSAAVLSYRHFSTPESRRFISLVSSLLVALFFGLFLDPRSTHATTVLVPRWIEVTAIAAHEGLLFNVLMGLVFVAFGKRVFVSGTAGAWLLIQALISLAFIAENTALFLILLVAALGAHLVVSQRDVYQVSRRGERYVLVLFSSVLSVAFALLFFLPLQLAQGVGTFTEISSSVRSLPISAKAIGNAFLMVMLGAFPLHFWVKPLFAAPARYGLAVITRVHIGFVVWAKLYPLVFSGEPVLDAILTYGCGANLLYAAFLLFGERKLSQIVSSLFLFHVPLLVLATRYSEHGTTADFMLDVANIGVAIGGLLIILGMLRDRLGAENIDKATGLATSYPFLGISFLVCTLSLTGFPGTLGFISSELILHHLAESTWPVAICFIVSIALNGYSSYRIFGESFYGDPVKTFRPILQPLRREKVALALIILFLFVTGIGPKVIEPSVEQPLAVALGALSKGAH